MGSRGNSGLRGATAILGSSHVPTRDEITLGDATYGGLPVLYHPEINSEARNLTTEIWVSDKFFKQPKNIQQHILNHEVAHNLSDEMQMEHYGDWNKFSSNFIEEKPVPETSLAYQRGQRTYWEGIYGDIGATAVNETTTRAITEYLDNPAGLRARSKKAYKVVDEFMKRRRK